MNSVVTPQLAPESSPADGLAMDLAAVSFWVKANSDEADPLPQGWVPGASLSELRQLRVLGGLVGGYYRSLSRAPEWPEGLPEVAEWLAFGVQPDNSVVEAVLRIADEGVDAVARLYASIVQATSRRRLGTFFTPPAEAGWMIERWNQLFGTPASVVDVGAGVGAFTVRAEATWPSSHLVPIDINPVTLGLFVLRPDTDSQRQHRGTFDPQLADFAAWSQSHFTDLPGPRLILGNPPYTRSQLIPPEQRAALRLATKGLCGPRASLSALMLGVSLKSLGASDGVCLLLPAQWLESDYAIELRRWIWSQDKRRVELHLFDSRLFSDAQVDAVCLIVGPEQSAAEPFITGSATSRDAIITSATRQHDRASPVPDNWRALFAVAGFVDAPTESTPLRDFATIRRGVATGANNFFTLSENEVAAWKLEDASLRPYLQRTRQLADATSIDPGFLEATGSGSKRYLLVISESDVRDSAVEKYLEYGKRIGVDKTYLASARRCWFDLTAEAYAPDVVVSAAARTQYAFLSNNAGVTITNNLYGLTWHATTPAGTRLAILSWLRSDEGQATMWNVSRTQAEGLRKMEVRALSNVPIPTALASVRTTLVATHTL